MFDVIYYNIDIYCKKMYANHSIVYPLLIIHIYRHHIHFFRLINLFFNDNKLLIKVWFTSMILAGINFLVLASKLVKILINSVNSFLLYFEKLIVQSLFFIWNNNFSILSFLLFSKIIFFSIILSLLLIKFNLSILNL